MFLEGGHDADVGDGANRLVPENAAIGDGGHIAVENVQVGTADGGGIDPYNDVGWFLDGGIWDVFPGLLAGSVVHQRFHRHLRD